MSKDTSQSRKRLILGVISLSVGFLAANFALFSWIERTGLSYLLAGYARYVCAYGGFGAMIFGSMLVNDYFVKREFFRKNDSESQLTTFVSAREKKEAEWTPVGTVIPEKGKRKKVSKRV